MVQPDYAFKDLTIPQLRGLATTFRVNLNGKTRKPEIVKAIEDAGITWNMYESLTSVPDEEPALSFEEDLEPAHEPEVAGQEPLPFEVEWPDYSSEDADFEADPVVAQAPVEPEVAIAPVEEKEPEYMVVKMDRENRVFQAFGYEFTRENPYMLVTQDEADVLIEEIGGFRASSPRELREYYGE